MGQKLEKTSSKQFLLEVLNVVEFSCQVGCQSCDTQLGWMSKMASSQAGSWCLLLVGTSAGAVHGLPPCGLSSIVGVFLQSNHPRRTRWKLLGLVWHSLEVKQCHCYQILLVTSKDTKSSPDLGEGTQIPPLDGKSIKFQSHFANFTIGAGRFYNFINPFNQYLTLLILFAVCPFKKFNLFLFLFLVFILFYLLWI